jgi:hypothetical protein
LHGLDAARLLRQSRPLALRLLQCHDASDRVAPVQVIMACSPDRRSRRGSS